MSSDGTVFCGLMTYCSSPSFFFARAVESAIVTIDVLEVLTAFVFFFFSFLLFCLESVTPPTRASDWSIAKRKQMRCPRRWSRELVMSRSRGAAGYRWTVKEFTRRPAGWIEQSGSRRTIFHRLWLLLAPTWKKL